MSKGLEALRKIGLMTTKRNLQDFPIGNQPKQIVKMKIKEMPEFQEVLNAINELERLKKFKETFDNYELSKRQDFIAFENWLECEGELEELKRDIARYFELANEEVATKEVIDELSKIRNKLLEVGKEEKENETN